MKLWDFAFSSASYRVRIALNVKGVKAEQIPVNLSSAEHQLDGYHEVNPQGLVPTLGTEQGNLGQSLAILEYLDAQYPEPPLLPKDQWQKAQVRAMAYSVACEIHPLQNLRVRKYLENELQLGEERRLEWIGHWITEGFSGLEQQVNGPKFCFGDQVTMADICLVPQMANARRYKVDLSALGKLVAIDEHLRSLPAFTQAAPQ